MAEELIPPGQPAEAPAPAETPAPPLERARKRAAGGRRSRFGPRPGRHGGNALPRDPAIAEETAAATKRIQVAMMRAGLCSTQEIARTLKIRNDAVLRIQAEAQTAALLDEARKIVRAYTIGESLDIAVKGMAWVNQAIDEQDPKAFDLVTRGMGNMEKIWSSASGEHKAAGTQVAFINNSPANTAAEIAQLIEMLVPQGKP